jgi:hypothetical protein
MRTATFLLVVSVLVPATARASNCLTIDDFSSGPGRSTLVAPNTTDTQTQAGNMIGGVRLTSFLIGANPFLQIAGMAADHPGNNGIPLVVTTGLRSGFRLDLLYGFDANFLPKNLNYFPTGCDRFRVTFDSASQTLNFNVVAWYNPDYGHHAQDGINLNPAPFTTTFCVDFLFSNFAPGIAGDTPDFPNKGILLLDLIFQTGSAIGGNEFAIKKIETVDPATAATNPCAIVAPPLGS